MVKDIAVSENERSMRRDPAAVPGNTDARIVEDSGDRGGECRVGPD
jgi:hypothetical protein